MLSRITFSVLIGVLVSSCATKQQENYLGQKIDSVSSLDSKRPNWTYDSGWKIEDIRKQYGDDTVEPKHAFVVSSASVKSDQSIPQCYAMAKTRASAEIGRQISETIKEAKALSQNSEELEFMNDIRSKANNIIVGYEEADKFYLKVSNEDDKPFKCWVLMKFPRKNLKTLQEYVLKALEKEAGGNQDLKANVQNATQKIMEEM